MNHNIINEQNTLSEVRSGMEWTLFFLVCRSQSKIKQFSLALNKYAIILYIEETGFCMLSGECPFHFIYGPTIVAHIFTISGVIFLMKLSNLIELIKCYIKHK